MMSSSTTSFVILLLLTVVFVQSVLSFSENLYHEEIYKHEEYQDAFAPVFLTNEPLKQLYATPKHCLRRDRTQRRKRSRTASSNELRFTSTWMEFLNEFYWDNGQEYTKWTHITEGIKERDKEPWYMVASVIVPISLYMLTMLFSMFFAPFAAFILFRICHLLWQLVSHNWSRNIMRRIWTSNEIRKRKQVLMMYRWTKKIPKIRAQLPWLLRRHPDEEVPNDMKDLIDVSSSAESSVGEDNLDFYYEGIEKENRDAIAANKAKTMLSEEDKTKDGTAGDMKAEKKIAPWRKGNTQKTLSNEAMALAQEKSPRPSHSHTASSRMSTPNAVEHGQEGEALKKVNSGEEFHV